MDFPYQSNRQRSSGAVEKSRKLLLYHLYGHHHILSLASGRVTWLMAVLKNPFFWIPAVLLDRKSVV